MSRFPLRNQSNTIAGGAATLGASLDVQPRTSATEATITRRSSGAERSGPDARRAVVERQQGPEARHRGDRSARTPCRQQFFRRQTTIARHAARDRLAQYDVEPRQPQPYREGGAFAPRVAVA